MERGIAVRASRNGLGIFTAKNFLAEDTLFEVKGEFISGDKEDDLEEKTRSNAFRFDKRKYISPAGRAGDFLNHSCNPNARVEKRGGKLFITAAENIRKGEEILIDYSTILASDDSWTMQCRCGEKHCRKVIKKFGSLPASLKKKYIAGNMVPAYILRI